MHQLRQSVLLAALVLFPAVVAAQAAPTYHVARTVRIGGDGGFDYVTADPAAKRVFLTHASRVIVYDLAKDAVAGEIPNTIGVHGVALAPDLNRGFTSNGRDSSVTIFDYTTLAVITVLPIHAINPDAITYDELTKRIFTWNHGTHDATVIDAAKGEVIGRIPNMGTPETAVTDGKGALWVNVEDSAMVVRIDTRTMREVTRFSIAPCDEPTGMAIDRANRVLFSVCDKVMAVIDADNGKMITTVPICGGPDAAAYDPGTKLVFASCGDGSLSVIRQTSRTAYAPVQTVTTPRGARTMALDPLTHVVYQMAVEYGPVPAATPGGRPPRAPIIPGSFSMLVIAP
ncbi:MAG: YncE family protein [Gemmatimonadetes bacterium]|nr:YncE family protein [Gemmatimonadota bacterium]